MRPWQHAKASAARGGRLWTDDLAIHEFVDSTKASLADLRHRMVLHNDDLGPTLAARAFAAHPHAERVAREHAREDLGEDVSLRWWLARCDPTRLPRVRNREDHHALVARATARFGLDDDGPVRAVLAVLTLPEQLAPAHGSIARAVLGNDAGIAIVRAVLGPATELPAAQGRRVVFDPAFCAEGMIHWWFGRIPSLRELASALDGQTQPALDDLRSPHRRAARARTSETRTR